MICLQCGTENSGSSSLCIRCGKSLTQFKFRGVATCKNHGNRLSTGRCEECLAPICSECTVVVGERTLCTSDAEVDYADDEENRIEHLSVADPARTYHAKFSTRLISVFIDGIVIFTLALLLTAVYWLLTGVPPIAIAVYRYHPFEFVSFWTLFVLSTSAYFIIFTIAEGQTLGKQAMRVAVVEQDGTTPTIRTAAIRYLTSFASVVCLGLGFFAILNDPQRRAWHDRWSNTYVVSLDEATERL